MGRKKIHMKEKEKEEIITSHIILLHLNVALPMPKKKNLQGQKVDSLWASESNQPPKMELGAQSVNTALKRPLLLASVELLTGLAAWRGGHLLDLARCSQQCHKLSRPSSTADGKPVPTPHQSGLYSAISQALTLPLRVVYCL